MIRLLDSFKAEFGSDYLKDELSNWAAVLLAIVLLLGANAAFGVTALSSLRDEAAFASSPSGLQSTFAKGE